MSLLFHAVYVGCVDHDQCGCVMQGEVPLQVVSSGIHHSDGNALQCVYKYRIKLINSISKQWRQRTNITVTRAMGRGFVLSVALSHRTSIGSSPNERFIVFVGCSDPILLIACVTPAQF